MYEAFESFIKVQTWYTRHPSDEERFYIALSKVVWSKDFSPEGMASYLRKKLNLSPNDHKNLISGGRLIGTPRMLGR